MNCIGATSLTCQASSGDNTIETTVIAGTRKLENILIRRIPQRGTSAGHYWIEIVHKDEDEMDAFIIEAKQQGLKEKDLKILNETPTKINGFRESYGWYPISSFPLFNVSVTGLFTFNSRAIKNDGCLNGDHVDRRKKDEELEINNTMERDAGRSQPKNDLSTIAFDCMQHRRFDLEEPIDLTTNPYLLPGDLQTEEQVIESIRNFAQEFEKTEEEWSFNFDGFDETNCHTLLFLLLASCDLADPDGIGQGLDKHFNDYKQSLNSKRKPDSKWNNRRILIEKLSKISKSLYENSTK